MKRILFIPLFIIHLASFGQNVGINPTGASPNSSAGLDIDFTNKGALIPRVALTQTSSASPVTSPATSLIVYNTATANDVTPGYYYWDGAKWVRMIDQDRREWSDLMALAQLAIDNAEVYEVPDGGAGNYFMTNGIFYSSNVCGGHRHLMGYVYLPAGKYQLTIQTRASNVLTNCNGGVGVPLSMPIEVYVVNGGTLSTDPTMIFVSGPTDAPTSKTVRTANSTVSTIATSGTYGIWFTPNQYGSGDYMTYLLSAKIWRLE